MSDINNNMIRVVKLLREHQANEQTLDGIDAETSALEARVTKNDSRAAQINQRQDEIAAELVPALAKTGPVTWDDKRVNYVVRLTPDKGLAIEELKSWGALASAMQPRRMFSDATIDEAARHAAINGKFPHPDDDDEFTGGYDDSTPMPADDSIRLPFHDYIARNGGGRTPTIANGIAVIDQEAG